MNPIPLLGPNGKPWTYCCGICGRLRGGTVGTVIGRSELEGDGRHPDQVECEHAAAERCCVCHHCRERQVKEHGAYVCLECEPGVKADHEIWEVNHAERQRKANEAAEESSKKTLDVDAMHLLYLEMSNISEDRHFAGWYTGIEYELWDEMQAGVSDESSELRRLHEKCGGWFYYNEELWTHLFVTTEEWLRMVEARRDK